VSGAELDKSGWRRYLPGELAGELFKAFFQWL
jgi:hypothetical protein